jgi:hypothetical protein
VCPNFLSFRYFHFELTFESIKELKNASHHHSLLVLVFFLAKEFSSLVFMVTLTKPSLGALLMAPNPSVT